MDIRKAAISFVFASTMLIGITYANYWFQFGARGGISSEFNNGTSVSIETVFPQNFTNGSPAFWVGEDLANGAFLQTGYLIANQTGSYPSSCSQSFGCGKYQTLKAGQEEWFYEYFPQGYNGGQFFGRIGPAGSAGSNGVFNTYGFYYNSSSGGWNFVFDGNIIGNVSIGSEGSGPRSPVAFGEIANASGNATIINPVTMKNLSVYKNGRFSPVAEGYAYIGYGSGSLQNVPVPYGVMELDNRVNYFQIGSGLPKPSNGTRIWSFGYNLSLKSAYGNFAGIREYLAYSREVISVPRILNLSNNTIAVFTGWQGSGYGSYTGPDNTTAIVIDSNVSETALWQIKYYLNVSTQYGAVSGDGWYDANSTIPYGIDSNTVYVNNATREIFSGWSNGNTKENGSIFMNSPKAVSAEWTGQYHVNVSSEYGNTTGNGWYFSGSYDTISVSPVNFGRENSSRYAFYAWSNGEENSSFKMHVTGPESLVAQYKKQYLHHFVGVDEYGKRIEAGKFYAGNQVINATNWLFAGKTYNITKAYYAGVWLPVSSNATIGTGNTTDVVLPVYDVEVYTRDIFGNPVNVTADIQFYNNTFEKVSGGSDGLIKISDVPYGEVNGTVENFLIPYRFSTGYGQPAYITMITDTDILLFPFVAIIAVLLYVIFSRKMHHNKPPVVPEGTSQETAGGAVN